jgi:hypothetical protein
VNAEFFTPGCLLNARPALTLPAGTVPPAVRGAPRAGRGGTPSIYRNRVFEALFRFLARISHQRGKIGSPLQEVDIPGLYLFWSFRVPAMYLGLLFRWSWPSHGGGLLTVAFHARHGPGGPGGALDLPVDAVPALAEETRAGARGVRFRRWCSAPGTPPPGTPPRRS